MKSHYFLFVFLVSVFVVGESVFSGDGVDFLMAEGSDVRSADTYRYHLVDSVGNRMDVVKVSQVSDQYYLAVYHSLVDGEFFAKLADSVDLENWTFRVDLGGVRSAMPDIERLSNNGYLVVFEKGNASGEIWLHFDYYQSFESLLQSKPSQSFDAPALLSTTSTKAEGTPDIGFVHLGPDIENSLVEVTFHYFRGGSPAVDRQASGRLIDFEHWEVEPNPELDQKLEELGCRGNIGGRERFIIHGEELLLIEGQIRPGDWSSWRTFVVGDEGSRARRVPLRTHSGSKAFGNPSFTRLVLPSGVIGYTFGSFLFSEGAAAGEAGPLLFVRKTGTRDIARTGTVRASSLFDRHHAPGNLIDGDGNTRWASKARGLAEWVEIDLGFIRPINHVEIRWEVAYASSYDVEVSVDGEVWETVVVREGARGGVTTDYFDLVPARYVRVLCARSGLDLALYSIWHIAVSQEATEAVHYKSEPIIDRSSIVLGGGEFVFHSLLSPGFGYDLEYSGDLDKWSLVETIIPESEKYGVRVPFSEQVETGFFRLR